MVLREAAAENFIEASDTGAGEARCGVVWCLTRSHLLGVRTEVPGLPSALRWACPGPSVVTRSLDELATAPHESPLSQEICQPQGRRTRARKEEDPRVSR